MITSLNKNKTPLSTALVVTYAAYGIAAIILATLFIENFLFSSGMDVLRFRAIDDAAFHETLRRLHSSIDAGHFRDLLVVNDYAYGWIFWVPLAIATYPLYLISAHFSIDWLLIVFPRQMSLMFGILSLVFLRQIFMLYKWPEWMSAVAILIFTLYPSFGYLSLRFGTVNEVMFFSILCFYLAAANNPSSGKGRLGIAVCMAIAGGVKLSGLLVAPLVFITVIFRYQYSTLIVLVRDVLLTASIFTLFLILFSNPALFGYFYNIDYWSEYKATITYFIGITNIMTGETNQLRRFYDVFFKSPINLICVLFLFLGLVIHALKDRDWRREVLLTLGVFICITLCLFIKIKNGQSAAIYFTAISFVLLFGVSFWGHKKFGRLILGVIVILLLVDVYYRAQREQKQDKIIRNHLSFFIKNNKSKPKIKRAKEIVDCIKATSRDWQSHIFIDFTIPTVFCPLNYPKACVSVAWNNLSAKRKYCDRPIDYLVLDKLAPGALPDNLFALKVAKADPKIADNLWEDRESRRLISGGGYFGGRRYKILCDFDTVSVYAAENIE